MTEKRIIMQIKRMRRKQRGVPTVQKSERSDHCRRDLSTESDHIKENGNGFGNEDTPRVINSQPIVDHVCVLEAFSKSF